MIEKNRIAVDWQDVRIFVALARHGSLSAAARTLDVNHATVARRLRSLEKSLGERLVERRPGGYTLTPAGVRTLAAGSDMEHAANLLGRTEADSPARGLIRINAPPALSNGFLTAHLASLASHHPKLDIELATNHRFVSLERYEADIAIRFGRPKDADLVARPLVTVGYGFYGTEAVCRSAASRKDLPLIGFNEANADLPEAAWLARRFPRGRLVFRAHDQVAQAVAARCGAGIALLPHYLGRSEPRLRICDLGATPPSKPVFLLTRTRDRNDTSIRTIADEVIAIFAKASGLFR